MKLFIARASASFFLLGLCIGSNPAAHAAEAQIEEIVVTAQKRESKLQETPIAITAITQEQISLNRIENFGDIAQHTPSMSYTELQGFSQIAIRGVGTDLTNLANETAVAMYQDGVYQRRDVCADDAAVRHGTHRSAAWPARYVVRPQRDRRRGQHHHAHPVRRTGVQCIDHRRQLRAHQRVESGASGPLNDMIAGRVSFVTDSHSGYNDNKTLGRFRRRRQLEGRPRVVGFRSERHDRTRAARELHARSRQHRCVHGSRNLADGAGHCAGQPRRCSDVSAAGAWRSEFCAGIRPDVPAGGSADRRRSRQTRVVYRTADEEQHQAVRR